MTTRPLIDDAVALHWIEAWDRQQAIYLPYRREQFDVVARLVAATGPGPRVLDLGCGPGSLGRAVHERVPHAHVTGIDHDPLLLALASAHERAGWLTVVDADLRQPWWTQRVTGPFDAAVAATALHWLPAAELERTYRAVLGLLRPGGILVNSDTMPDSEVTIAWAGGVTEGDGGHGWQQWWRDAQSEPALAPAVALRASRRGGVASAEFTPPAQWHIAALARAGFVNAHVQWRQGPDAVLTAVRP